MTALGTWTDEQRRAVQRREGDLLLDAGAGSGKTSVLVERFARAVIDDGVDVSSMLAITFTEKAAAELRDRVRARLRELGAADQARATEGAFISTIHGFCARVLRAGALAAGLDPGFVVLDSEQSEPLATAAFDDALNDLAAEDAGAVALLADYGAGPLRAATRSIHAQLRSRGQRVPRLPAAPAEPGPDARRALESTARAVAAELGAIASPGAKVVEALERLDRCLALLGDDALWPAALDRAKLPANGAALSTDACGDYAEALSAYRAVCAARVAGPVRDRFDALLAAFGTRYEARKRAVSGVDFEDLELLTLELLRTNPDLRERYAARFQRVMVDELQDTNRVQLELIELIASTNLFTVGDAQQSIYRFRHADVELFERRGELLAARGERETLRVNFRSRPEILSALNAAFETELGDRFKPLIAGRDDGPEPGEHPRVELLLVDKGADWELEGLAAPWRLAEARALAERVARLVRDGTPPGEIVVLIRATTDMRAYERALERHGLPTYVVGGRGYWLHPQVLDMVAYLRALSNPLDEESLYTVLTSPLVGASLDTLVVLADEARERGCDPWTLVREPGDALDSLAASDRLALQRFAAWFAEQRLGATRVGLEQLIDEPLRLTGYDVAMLALPYGRRRLANVRKLMGLARDFEREHGPDLRGFVELIGERAAGRAGGARESEAPVEGEGLDGIRLMTIHRAKGLEFDTVCVADLGRSVRPPYELVRVSADGRLGLRLIRSGQPGRVSAWDYDAIGVAEKEADELEERRLFYVAMTRARERLILSGATRFEGWAEGRWTGGGPVGWIAPAFVPALAEVIADGGGEVALGDTRVRVSISAPESGRSGSPEPGVPGPPGPGEAGPTVPGMTEPAEVRAAAEPAPPSPPTSVGSPAPPVTALSYTSLGAYARCGYRFYAERVLGLPPRPISDQGGSAVLARSAADRGVLVHALLERLNFRRPAPPSAEAIAAAAAGAGLRPPTLGEADELAGLIGVFASSELCARLGRATDARPEERFSFELADGVLITGAIDVLARERDGTTLIVDYKSDRLVGADPATIVQGAYTTQRLVYAIAALRARAARVEVAHCFLESPDQPVRITFERSQLAGLERELEQLAAGVLERTFEVSPTPRRGLCAGCPAEGGLCSWPLASTRRESADCLF
jgi:ATP-dependent helicase/nuclease subunit A